MSPTGTYSPEIVPHQHMCTRDCTTPAILRHIVSGNCPQPVFVPPVLCPIHAFLLSWHLSRTGIFPHRQKSKPAICPLVMMQTGNRSPEKVTPAKVPPELDPHPMILFDYLSNMCNLYYVSFRLRM